MSTIVVEDLVKRYVGVTSVEDVSFTAAAGEVTALLGPNGAGKTTTIEILEGFQAGPGLAGQDRAGPAVDQPGRSAHRDRGADAVRRALSGPAPGQ